MILAVGNDSQFVRLCAELGVAELAADPRFATNRARVANRAALIPALNRQTVTRTTAQWIETLEAVGVPCGLINDLAGVFADPQVVARGLQVGQMGEDGCVVPQVASPMRLSASPVEHAVPPPALGADNVTVLADWLGMDGETVAALGRDGVI